MRWLINILSNYLRFGISIGVMVVMTPYVLASLGAEEYGLWVLLFSAISLVGLSDLGFATTAVKYLAETAGADQVHERNTIFGLLLSIYLSIGILTIAICFAASELNWLADVNHNDFKQLFLLMGTTTAGVMALSVYRAALIATGHQHWVNHFALTGTLIQALLTYYMLENGLGLAGVCYANCAGLIISSLICIPAAKLLIPSLRPNFEFPWNKNRKNIKQNSQRTHINPGSMLIFSFHALMANAAFMLIFRIDPFIVQHHFDLTQVTLLAVAVKIAEQALLFNKQFSNGLMPLISQLQGRSAKFEQQQLLIMANRYLTLIAVPTLMLLAIFSEDVLYHWLGNDYTSGAELLSWMSLGCLLTTLQFNAANLLGMTGNAAFVARCMMSAALMKAGLMFVLLPVLGIKAAGISLCIAFLLSEFIPCTLKVCRVQGINLQQYLVASYLPGLTSAVSCAVVALTLSSPASLSQLFITCVISGSAALLTFNLLWLNNQEKAFLLRLIPGIRTA